jgi:hypothetical protein
MAGSASMPLEVIHAFVELDGGVMTAVVKVKPHTTSTSSEINYLMRNYTSLLL